MSPRRSLFREVNERIRQVNQASDGDHEVLLCECGRNGCSERLEVPVDVYDTVRAHERSYLVAPGHERSDQESVVAGTPDYLVVTGIAGS